MNVCFSQHTHSPISRVQFNECIVINDRLCKILRNSSHCPVWVLAISCVGTGTFSCTQGAALYTGRPACTPSESIKTPEASTRKYFYAEHREANRGTQPVALLIPQNRFLVSLFLHSLANRSSRAVRCDPVEGTCAMFCSDKLVNLLFAEREVKTIFNFSNV